MPSCAPVPRCTASGSRRPPQPEQHAMFKVIGAAVVYGFALFGLATWLGRDCAYETETR